MSDFIDRIKRLSPKGLALLALDLQTRLGQCERRETEPIAVIGLGCRFPGGVDNPESYWRLLRKGVDAITVVPSDRWDVDAYYDPDAQAPGKMATRWGGFLEQIDQFDARFFGIAPREAVSLDPQQRILMEVVWEAIEHSGLPPDRLIGSRTGVFVGICTGDYYQRVLQGNPDNFDAYLVSGSAPSMAAGRISYLLGLQGPSFVLDTACSSSLVAVHVACQSLKSGECDMVLAGGVSLILNPEPTIGLSKAGMLSPDGRCRSFDADANGFVRGEGCGVIVLKRLSDAEANGDNILAIIRGSAVNQDGRSSGITVPNGPAQEALIRQALEKSRVKPADVDYVETHGTATKLGDPIEVRALGTVLSQDRLMQNPVRIGSVKTNFGHLEMCAGIAGFIKVVLALQHEEIPPHLHLNRLNPYIEWDRFPVIVPTRNTPWPVGERRRIAGVSSFGFSGTNAHVILEEAPPQPSAARTELPFNIFTLSAKSEPALQELAARYEKDLERNPSRSLSDVSYTANTGRSHFAYRLAVVSHATERIQQALATVKTKCSAADVQTGRCNPTSPPDVVFLFTGQGSQYIDMGRDLYAVHPIFRAALDRCGEILAPYLERPLLSVLYPGSDSAQYSELLLNQTAFTQPALFAVEYALAELWRSWGVQPAAVLGHSLGEFAAACVAGAFSLEDGLRLVAERGRLMQALPTGGAMAAVFANETEVLQTISAYGRTVSISAVNGPDNTVISGNGGDIEAILNAFERRGTGFRRLTVSHAFHSPLMEPMLDEFEKAAEAVQYSQSSIELIANVTGKTASIGDCATAAYWRRHTRLPVRFAASMQHLYTEGYRIFVEVGPAPVLAGMASRYMPEAGIVWLPSLRQGQIDNRQIFGTLGALYVRGVKIDWEGVYRGSARRRVPLPTYPFQRKRYWIEKRSRKTPEMSAESVKPWHDWLYEIKWKLAEFNDKGIDNKARPEDSVRSKPRGCWLLMLDEGGVGKSLEKVLLSHGETCITADKGTSFAEDGSGRYCIDPHNVDDYKRLFDAALKKNAHPFAGVINFWALDEKISASDGYREMDRSQQRVCGSTLYLAQTLAVRDATSQQRLFLLTRGVQPIHSSADSMGLAQSTLWGLGKVVMLEHPELCCMCIDLDPNPKENEMRQLFDDVLSVRPEYHQVALRHQQWWVPQVAPKDLSEDFRDRRPFVFRGDGVYLITGGLAGLGLHLAQWLVMKGARHLILMGRSGASEAAGRVIAQMQKQGAAVAVVRGDVTEPDHLKRALEKNAAGRVPLCGVFHCAGTLDDGVLLQQNWDRFRSVMSAKVQGAWNLHELTRNVRLDCFVMFSSAATMLGSPGQGNYAAANAFLDELVHYRRRQGLPGLSVNWGAWNKVGMASRRGVIERLKTQGFDALEPELALDVLEFLLGSDATQIAVLPVHWSALTAQFGNRPEMGLIEQLSRTKEKKAPQALQPETIFLQQWNITPAGKRHNLLMGKIHDEAARVLGLQPAEQIDPYQPLSDLGLDSLMAVHLRNALSSLTGRPLPATLLFNYPSLEQLSGYLGRVMQPLQEDKDTAEHGPHKGRKFEKSESMHAEHLEQLSEDDMAFLLAEKLKEL